MAKKTKAPVITKEQLLSLCDKDEATGNYIAKSGTPYIEALGRVFDLNNLNDRPFTVEDILQQPCKDDFAFGGVQDYVYICDLKARPLKMFLTGKKQRQNEKIEVVPNSFQSKHCQEVFEKATGVSYLLTCKIEDREYMIKIGQTRLTFQKRLGSYNCGVVYNWRTASTTNIKILQSFVTTRLTFRLYLYDCSDCPYVLKDWHGVTSQPFASPKSLAVEDIMIKQFMAQFGQKPLANVQADATSND